MEEAPVVVMVWNAEEMGWETEALSVAAAIQNMLLKAMLARATLNNTTTTMTYILGITTIIFAVMTALLFMLNRKIRGISQPLA